jgi:hypothetical protein
MSNLMQSMRSWRQSIRNRRNQRVVRLAPFGRARGNVLLSYLKEPFLAGAQDEYWHINWWRCRAIVQTLLDVGWAVDVISPGDRKFLPTRDYQLIFDDNGENLSHLAPHLGNDCFKLMFGTMQHWLFHNQAELRRLLDLKERRGVGLVARRQLHPSDGLELCDLCMAIGNEHTLGSFRHAGKPLVAMPNSPTREFEWHHAKDFLQARRKFLWLGSHGLVLKGLDLVLEAFAGMPELELTVCGPIGDEPDFAACYRRELFETPNIHTLGFTDLRAGKLDQAIAQIGAMMYPSASDGCAGAVVNCMHAGLVPLVSRESGVEVGDFGQFLPQSTIPAIRQSAREFSRRSAEDVRARSRAAWEFARRHYTRAAFLESFRQFVEQIATAGQAFQPGGYGGSLAHAFASTAGQAASGTRPEEKSFASFAPLR